MSQLKSGFPSFSLTMLCWWQSQTEKDSRDSTLCGQTGAKALNSQAEALPSHTTPLGSRLFFLVSQSPP